MKNTKECLKVIFTSWKMYKSAAADGKVDLSDLMYVMPVINDLKIALEDVNQVGAELSPFTMEKATELLAFAKAELGEVMDDAQLKKKLNAAFAVLAAVVVFVQVMKNPDAVPVQLSVPVLQ